VRVEEDEGFTEAFWEVIGRGILLVVIWSKRERGARKFA